MHRLLILAVISSAFIVSSCNEENTSSTSNAADIPADQIAATVNSTVISKDDLNNFKELKGNPQVPDDTVLDEMIATELLREEAIKAGIADKKDVRFQIRLQESEMLARLLMREKFGSISFSDEELKAAYDKQMNDTASSEFKARHILLKTEDEAQAVIEALRNGEDFVKLAKERSTGPSGPNGGDLGWFQASRMVPPFAEAVKLMNKGDVSVAPVQTDFGFHVIKLEDMRELEKPSFESMRDQLQQSLIREAINDYIQEVQAAATIIKS
ncbi:MAG: peptidylprolyl isomerase [Gammaproteobacteria bacterium]|nr:peptidylprolyl isomerase [Gammaproteobacteria bacterium]